MVGRPAYISFIRETGSAPRQPCRRKVCRVTCSFRRSDLRKLEGRFAESGLPLIGGKQSHGRPCDCKKEGLPSHVLQTAPSWNIVMPRFPPPCAAPRLGEVAQILVGLLFCNLHTLRVTFQPTTQSSIAIAESVSAFGKILDQTKELE